MWHVDYPNVHRILWRVCLCRPSGNLRCWDNSRGEILKQEKLIKQVRRAVMFSMWKTCTWLNLISKICGISSRCRQGLYRDMEEESRMPHLVLGYKYIHIFNRISAPPHPEEQADVVGASGQDTWRDSRGGLPGKYSREESPRRTSLQRVRSGWLPSSSRAPCGWAGWISWRENVLGLSA